MTRRRGALLVWLLRPSSLAEAGFYLLILTLVPIPWGYAAVVPARLVREIAIRLAPATVPAVAMLPEGLPITALTGMACVLCGVLHLAFSTRRLNLPALTGLGGFAGPFLLLLVAAGLHGRQDPEPSRTVVASGTAALAVAACGYLFLRDLDNPATRLIRLIRAFTLSCATAAAVRLALPDLSPMFDTGSTDALAVPLGAALTVSGVRFLARAGAGFDAVLLQVVALETGYLYPAGALLIAATLTVIPIFCDLRHHSGLVMVSPGRLLLLWLSVTAATALSAGTLVDSVQGAISLCTTVVHRMVDNGWAGSGPGTVTLLLQMSYPWRFPLPVPPWLLTLLVEYGLIGLAAYGWLWLLLFRRAFRATVDGSLKSGLDSNWPRTARTALSALFLAIPVMPAPPTLFLISAAALGAAFFQSSPLASPAYPAIRPASGRVFTFSGSLLTAALLVFLALNVVRLGCIARLAGSAADVARSAWAAEERGDYPSAQSAWSDAAWRTALLAVLDASTNSAESPATAAMRRSGMDRLLAETPGWFSHPDIRLKLPGQWPLVKAALDAAHFGQARAAWGLGHIREAQHWLEAIGRRTAGYWPEVLVVGGILLRTSGQPETGDALIRLATEQARALPELPPWAPTTAQPFSRFVAFLGQTAP